MIFRVFFTLYGLAHIIIWQTVATGLGLGDIGQGILVSLLLVLAAAPLLARRLERRNHVAAGRIWAWVGYTWAGIVLLFVLTRLVVAIYLLLAGVFDWWPSRHPDPLVSLLLTGVLTLILAAYAFIERSRIRIERIDLPTDKELGPRPFLRVAQISDVHIGSMNGRRRVRAMIRRLTEADPDIVVSTGDLIDSRVGLAVPVTDLLAALQPRLGKFAVLGNHECYAGLGSSLDFMERAGFIVLRNTSVALAGVHLVGMDDPAAGQSAQLEHKERQVLGDVPQSVFTILLKHRPDLVAGSAKRFDLQLSGHTHKGQMFPFGFLTRLYYPAHAGLFRLARASYLYVSRGTGAWGPPFRLMAPPEITLFTIGRGRPDPGGQLLPLAAESRGVERAAPAPIAVSPQSSPLSTLQN